MNNIHAVPHADSKNENKQIKGEIPRKKILIK